jgi:hypothetical protein
MTMYGYTLMTEQSGPVDLVRYAQVGGANQPEFLDWAEQEFLPALRG